MTIDLKADPAPAGHGVSTFETMFGFIPDDLSSFDEALLFMESPCPTLRFTTRGKNWRVEVRVRLNFNLGTLEGGMGCSVSSAHHSASGEHVDPSDLAAYMKALRAASAIVEKVDATTASWDYDEAKELVDEWRTYEMG